MQRFKNILVVCLEEGRIEPAVEVAAALAERNGADLKIVDAVRPAPSYMGILDVDELVEQATCQRRESLEKVASVLRDQGLRVTTDVLWGIPFVEVIRQVQIHGCDLVIKTAGDRGALSSNLFGSTDLHLLRKSPCPVWLLKPEARPTFARVLAAVDPAVETREGRALNRMILELSTSLVAIHGGRLDVAHCWEVPSVAFFGRSTAPLEKLDKVRGEVFKRVEDLFKDLLSDFNAQIPGDQRHLLEGPPEKKLAELVASEKTDLLVMGTVARTGIPGLLIGNTAERLISRVDCAVLTAKPDGFVSPVILPPASAST